MRQYNNPSNKMPEELSNEVCISASQPVHYEITFKKILYNVSTYENKKLFEANMAESPEKENYNVYDYQILIRHLAPARYWLTGNGGREGTRVIPANRNQI